MSATDTLPHDDHTGHDSAAHGGGHEHGLPDKGYVVVALILAVMTGIEVALSYIDVGPVFMPALLILMALKFFIVVSFFMHLKFDNKLFTAMFYSGLALAVFVYCGALLTFKFFNPA